MARIRFSEGEGTVTDGPFTEAKELLGEIGRRVVKGGVTA